MKVGQRILCVNDSVKEQGFISVISHYQNWIVKDKEYTIREMLSNDDIVTGLLLEEVKNKPIYIKLIDRVQEPAFATWRFRELQEEVSYNQEEEVISNLLQIAIEIEKL